MTQPSDVGLTRGQRAADAVARFGGSWPFVVLFSAILVVWIGLNTFVLANYGKDFDPYPYILLNLFLSMAGAIQAPFILMSQNRQSENDRIRAARDYEINQRAEREIMMLNDKIDQLLERTKPEAKS